MYHPGLCHFHAVTGHQALGIIGNYRLIIISFTLASMILSLILDPHRESLGIEPKRGQIRSQAPAFIYLFL
jgi:hypothetical protein